MKTFCKPLYQAQMMYTDICQLTEHGHILQRLETPAAPQGFIAMNMCITRQVKGWFCAE